MEVNEIVTAAAEDAMIDEVVVEVTILAEGTTVAARDLAMTMNLTFPDFLVIVEIIILLLRSNLENQS